MRGFYYVGLQDPSTVTPEGPYSCHYCNGRFTSSDLYERHVVKSHKGWTAYLGPSDIKQYEKLHDSDNRSKSKVADMTGLTYQAMVC